MREVPRSRPITRRAAVRRLAAAAAGVAASWRIGRAEQPLSGQRRPAVVHGAIRLEEQATGAEIWQVTTEQLSQSNIYCEVPYCSADSRYFVYQRQDPKLAGNRTEWMVVELGTWQQHRLDVGTGTSGCAISPGGVFYYLKRAGGQLDLKRADLSQGVAERIYGFDDAPRPASLGTVSSDGRYYAAGCRLDEKWQMFGIMLVDLKTGTQAIIDRDPFILNPHPQFEPGDSKQLMIQHNRGGKYTPEGKLLHLVGPEGATLYLLSVPDGKRTELKVGKPFTTPCTGHEAWIGKTREMLLSVSASGDYAPEKGNLLGVRAEGPARVVAKGYRFNHVGVSRCGRFFCCDDWRGSYKVVIGSVATGKTAVVCDSKTSPTSAQNTHPHAYLTPDLKWVIFNSNRSGFPHVQAARVPGGMIRDLS
jgi:hypothetical protein